MSSSLNLSSNIKSLHEENYQLWLESTIDNLKQGNFARIDIDNLIEEISEMGGSLKDALENNLIVILAHLLKETFPSQSPFTPEQVLNNQFLPGD
jgi:hypothetical protein